MTTDRTFKARWSQLLIEAVGVIGGGVAFVAWKGVAVTWFIAVFLVGYLIYRLLLHGAIVKTVRLNSDGVDIVPLLPWFRPRQWRVEELATYKSVAFHGRLKSRPFMGILKPKEGKHEIIWASGTDEFSALDEMLCKLLPSPQEPADVDAERRIS